MKELTKRVLRRMTTAVVLAVLLAATIPTYAQHYNWPAEQAVRRQIINQAILRQATRGRSKQVQRQGTRNAKRLHRAR